MSAHQRRRTGLAVGLVVGMASVGAARGEWIGRWTFNEGEASRSIAYDSRGTIDGKFKDGTLLNGPTYVASPGGYALSLDGVNDYVSFGADSSVNLTGALSLEAWVNVTSATGEPMIVGKSTGIYGLTYYPVNGRVYFYGGGSGSNHLSHVLPAGWNHVVGTVDPAGSGSNMHLYVNGVLVASRVSSAVPADNAGNPLLCGTDPTLASKLNAKVDELRIYSHALTGQQVLDSYHRGANRIDYPDSLAGKWTFNKGSGTVAADSADVEQAGQINEAAGNPTYVASTGSYALSLDETGDYVSFGAPAQFNLTGALSLEAWVNVTAAVGEPMILGKSTGLYALTYYPVNGKVYFYGGGSGTNHLSATLGSGWHHVAGTVDPAATGNNMHLYIDGVKVASRVSASAMPDNASNPLLCGTDASLNDRLTAQVEELRLHNRALTDLEVQTSHTVGATRTIYVNTSQNLKTIVESAADNTELLLDSGTFNLSTGVQIAGKHITLVGQSQTATTVKAASNVYIIFELTDGVEDFKIKKMKISGTTPLQINTHGVASTSGASVVRRVCYRDLTVQDVAVALSVGSGPNNTYDRARILNNTVLNIGGTEAGTGYGIHNDSAENVVIKGNVIVNTQRHAIYQGRGRNNVLIEDNLILNHDLAQQQPHRWASALCVARSRGVRLIDNVVANCRTVAATIEYDTDPDTPGEPGLSWPVKDITAVNNKILGTHKDGYMINTDQTVDETHTFLGTQISLVNTSGFYAWVFNQGRPTPPAYSPAIAPPDNRWLNPAFVATTAGKVYVMKNNTLDQIHPETWTYQTSPTTWFSTAGMDGMNGLIYVVQNNVLHEVNPLNWTYRYDSQTNWAGTTFLAAADGFIYIIQNNVLHKVNPATWHYAYASLSVTPAALYRWNGNVYLMSNTFIHYQINKQTLALTQISQ